jgi:hypothetical protein
MGAVRGLQEELFEVTSQRPHQMKIQALAAAGRFFFHERKDAVRAPRGVTEKRDSETVGPTAQDEAQMSLFH